MTYIMTDEDLKQILSDFYAYAQDKYNDDMYYEYSDDIAEEYLKSLKDKKKRS